MRGGEVRGTWGWRGRDILLLEVGLGGGVVRKDSKQKEAFDLSHEEWVGFQEAEQGEKTRVEGRHSGNKG